MRVCGIFDVWTLFSSRQSKSFYLNLRRQYGTKDELQGCRSCRKVWNLIFRFFLINSRKAEQENMKQAKKAEEDERRDAEEWARGANSRAAARQKV
jgi:hypothetical protein